jgi:hypothetical protein
MAHTQDIAVHFNRLDKNGGTLVVVAIGTDVYGASGADPAAVLGAAASKAAQDFTARGRSLDPGAVVARGMRLLAAMPR